MAIPNMRYAQSGEMKVSWNGRNMKNPDVKEILLGPAVYTAMNKIGLAIAKDAYEAYESSSNLPSDEKIWFRTYDMPVKTRNRVIVGIAYEKNPYMIKKFEAENGLLLQASIKNRQGVVDG